MKNNINLALGYANDLKEGVDILTDMNNGNSNLSLGEFRQFVNSYTKGAISHQIGPIRNRVQNTSAQNTSNRITDKMEKLFKELPDSYVVSDSAGPYNPKTDRDYSYNSEGSERPLIRKRKKYTILN